MPNVVTEAMIESYALMFLVMSAFFVYFCGMVWAFCNPKLSGSAEETDCDASSFPQAPLQQIFADLEDVESNEPTHTRQLTRGECLDQPTQSYIASSYIVD
ncbi:hypothetical protein QQF64_028601 [Cirrhinus molitorella]|uniref:Uncharacterized protein n=1 Tax=Cirrhinus molitorella TaxID=172907 RepID=A0ABR3N790_9TELE